MTIFDSASEFCNEDFIALKDLPASWMDTLHQTILVPSVLLLPNSNSGGTIASPPSMSSTTPVVATAIEHDDNHVIATEESPLHAHVPVLLPRPPVLPRNEAPNTLTMTSSTPAIPDRDYQLALQLQYEQHNHAASDPDRIHLSQELGMSQEELDRTTAMMFQLDEERRFRHSQELNREKMRRKNDSSSCIIS